MALEVHETRNFILKGAEKPHITRSDGGHLVIFSKGQASAYEDLDIILLPELAMLLHVGGKALKEVMNERGVDVQRINYQSNGNYGGSFHYHIYGRAKSSKFQEYGQALYLPDKNTNPEFYSRNEPLTLEDCLAISKRIEEIARKD